MARTKKAAAAEREPPKAERCKWDPAGAARQIFARPTHLGVLSSPAGQT
jgi:hypothetical protein